MALSILNPAPPPERADPEREALRWRVWWVARNAGTVGAAGFVAVPSAWVAASVFGPFIGLSSERISQVLWAAGAVDAATLGVALAASVTGLVLQARR